MENKYTFFVSSDIHGAYTYWMEALKEKGYDENNDKHIIIICGDAFDRFSENTKVLGFLKEKIAQKKLVYICGNHEDMALSMMMRGYPKPYDYHNRTADTILELAGFSLDQVREGQCTWLGACTKASEQLTPIINRALNYFETEKYIFCHGWLPQNYYEENGQYKYGYDALWRDASNLEWQDARWVNGIHAAFRGQNKTGKTVIFGHWHCSCAWYYDLLKKCQDEELKDTLLEQAQDYQFGSKATFTPYYGTDFIAIDACTAVSHKVNVLVLEDTLLEGEELENYFSY